MIYIEGFRLENDYLDRGIKAFYVDFYDVNIIVGENGSGKSTLLNCLFKNKDICKLYLSKRCQENKVTTLYFDSEKDNPRTQKALAQESTKFRHQIASHFHSHGETILSMLDGLQNEEDRVLFIDEPESGISLQNQNRIYNWIKKASRKNQLFVATHSYVIISKVKRVFDMQSLQWIDSNKYLHQALNTNVT